ncbi:hypothetical protein J6590_028391 [Homalodisca vitripennis]|nr:hypothetical protein J6590_028391 [Homalodisca vitripennis]
MNSFLTVESEQVFQRGQFFCMQNFMGSKRLAEKPSEESKQWPVNRARPARGEAGHWPSSDVNPAARMRTSFDLARPTPATPLIRTALGFALHNCNCATYRPALLTTRRVGSFPPSRNL